jgi:excisionase family DNA binding protein
MACERERGPITLTALMCGPIGTASEAGRNFERGETMLNKETTREIVKVKDLAEYLHCHQSTIYRLAKRGEIPGFRLGGGWRFKIDEIDRWCRRSAIDRGSSRSSHASM